MNDIYESTQDGGNVNICTLKFLTLTQCPYFLNFVDFLSSRIEAELSNNDTAEFCDPENHGKVYEDELIWKILKIASRILGMMIDIRCLFTFTLFPMQRPKVANLANLQ